MRPKITCRFHASRQFSLIRPTATRIISTQLEGLVCISCDPGILSALFAHWQCSRRFLCIPSFDAVLFTLFSSSSRVAYSHSISLLLCVEPTRLSPTFVVMMLCPFASHSILFPITSMRQNSPSYPDPDHSRGLLSCHNRLLKPLMTPYP